MIDMGDSRTLDQKAEDDINIALRRIAKAVDGVGDDLGDIRVVRLALLQGPNRLANALGMSAFGRIMSRFRALHQHLERIEDKNASKP